MKKSSKAKTPFDYCGKRRIAFCCLGHALEVKELCNGKAGTADSLRKQVKQLRAALTGSVEMGQDLQWKLQEREQEAERGKAAAAAREARITEVCASLKQAMELLRLASNTAEERNLTIARAYAALKGMTQC